MIDLHCSSFCYQVCSILVLCGVWGLCQEYSTGTKKIKHSGSVLLNQLHANPFNVWDHLSWQFRPCMVKQFPGQSPMVIYWCLFLVDTACNHVLRNNESRQHNFQHWMQVWTLVTHYCILHFEQLGKVNLTKSTIQPVKVHLHMLCVVVCACFCLMCNIVLDI